MDILLDRTKETLSSAREHYGYKNQILVAIEELNELACVLAKYPRYELHEDALQNLRPQVLEELADVFNVIDHIQDIFGITDEEVVIEAAHKGDRLLRWLDTEGMQVTTEERDVPKNPCPMCMYNGADPFAMPCFVCKTQPGYKGFVKRKS